VRELYEAFARLATKPPDVVVAPAKTRIGFQAETIFAAVTPRRRWLAAHVVLQRRLEHARIDGVESFGPNVHLHRFRVASPEDLDATLAGWLREAYEGYGRGHHVTPSLR
jgi:hypothetical protein